MIQPPENIQPECMHFGICGGCSLQNLDPISYREHKESLLNHAVENAGYSSSQIEDLVFIGKGSRRRAMLHIQPTKNSILFGYYKKNTHNIVDIQHCPALEEELEKLLPEFRKLIEQMHSRRAIKELDLLLSDSGIEVQISATSDIDGSDRKTIETFCDAHSIARFIWRTRREAQNIVYEYPSQLAFGDIVVNLPKGAFVQATREGQKAITAIITTELQGCNHVVDLYSGCGTYTIPISQSGMEVVAIEGSGAMVNALNKACTEFEINNISAKSRDLYKKPLTANELNAFDAIVINPPRNGAGPQIEEIAQSSVPKVILVSCNTHTLERDLKTLKQRGYVLERAIPIDQFYWTNHLESVVVLTRPH